MDKFGARVRIGDSTYHTKQTQVAAVLRHHVETGCWSSSRQHDVRPGMPVIASHAGAGQGQLERGALTNPTIIDCDRLRQEIERRREQGWASVDEEREQEMRCAAAPIRDVTNELIAAIDVSVLAASTPRGLLPKEYLLALPCMAAAIEADLASDSPHAGAR